METPATATVPPEPKPGRRLAPVYLSLFNGKIDKRDHARLDVKGVDGPVLGPLAYLRYGILSFHIRTAALIDGAASDDTIDLSKSEGSLYYDGMYYGDWSVFSGELTEEMKGRLQQIDYDKAVSSHALVSWICTKCGHDEIGLLHLKPVCRQCSHPFDRKELTTYHRRESTDNWANPSAGSLAGALERVLEWIDLGCDPEKSPAYLDRARDLVANHAADTARETIKRLSEPTL